MAADTFFSEGNQAFADDDYNEAVKKYTAAIEQDSHNPKYYSQRANALIKIEKYKDALADTLSALRLDSECAKAFVRKGIALYHLKEFNDAKEAFESGLKLENADDTKKWISKCDAELQTRENSGTDIVDSKLINETLPKVQPKPRYDWYQTDSRVVITILVKNRTSEDVKCDIQETCVSISVRIEDGSDFSLSFNLANKIVAARSKHKISSSKIEIQLMKSENVRWSSLEKKDSIQFNKFPVSAESGVNALAGVLFKLLKGNTKKTHRNLI